MNLKQVEELIQKMKEFEAILDQDRKGCINIAGALEPLRNSVFAEYRIQVVAAYQTGELIKSPTYTPKESKEE